MKKLLLVIPAAMLATACQSVGLDAENTGNAVYDSLIQAGEDPEVARAVADAIKRSILESSDGTGFLDILSGVGNVAATLVAGYFGIKIPGQIFVRKVKERQAAKKSQ